jgi:hypothetical protein
LVANLPLGVIIMIDGGFSGYSDGNISWGKEGSIRIRKLLLEVFAKTRLKTLEPKSSL